MKWESRACHYTCAKKSDNGYERQDGPFQKPPLSVYGYHTVNDTVSIESRDGDQPRDTGGCEQNERVRHYECDRFEKQQ